MVIDNFYSGGILLKPSSTEDVESLSADNCSVNPLRFERYPYVSEQADLKPPKVVELSLPP